MNGERLFSIVTPCLNDLEMLKRNVDSVRRQDGVRVEHVVQDGGSIDGSPEWLAERADVVVRSEADDGMYDALNKGMARSQGHYLAWLNGDEQYQPDALQSVQRIFETRPDVDILFGDYIVADGKGQGLAARREIPFRWWTIVNGLLYVQSCALFFRREAWDACGPFDTSYRICGDKEWLLRAAQKGLRIHHVPLFLGLFTITARNLSSSPQIKEESERVREAFGASRHAIVRRLARFCRAAEKAVRGHYIPRTVRYTFCDSSGTLHSRTCRLGGRWQQTMAAADEAGPFQHA